MRRVQDLRILPVVLEAWMTFFLTRIYLLSSGKDRIFANFRMLSSWEPATSPPASGEVDASSRRVKRSLAAAARRLPWRPSCVVQSLVSARMLRRRRIPAVLFVGVRQGPGGALEAHTWVRAGGVVVCGGGSEGHFTELVRYALDPNG